VKEVSKRKKDASKTGLSSPEVKGQGTTEQETGNIEMDSSRKQTKRT